MNPFPPSRSEQQRAGAGPRLTRRRRQDYDSRNCSTDSSSNNRRFLATTDKISAIQKDRRNDIPTRPPKSRQSHSRNNSFSSWANVDTSSVCGSIGSAESSSKNNVPNIPRPNAIGAGSRNSSHSSWALMDTSPVRQRDAMMPTAMPPKPPTLSADDRKSSWAFVDTSDHSNKPTVSQTSNRAKNMKNDKNSRRTSSWGNIDVLGMLDPQVEPQKEASSHLGMLAPLQECESEFERSSSSFGSAVPISPTSDESGETKNNCNSPTSVTELVQNLREEKARKIASRQRSNSNRTTQSERASRTTGITGLQEDTGDINRRQRGASAGISDGSGLWSCIRKGGSKVSDRESLRRPPVQRSNRVHRTTSRTQKNKASRLPDPQRSCMPTLKLQAQKGRSHQELCDNHVTR